MVMKWKRREQKVRIRSPENLECDEDNGECDEDKESSQ